MIKIALAAPTVKAVPTADHVFGLALEAMLTAPLSLLEDVSHLSHCCC